MPPKQRTKGKLEIYRENQSALEFYWRISVVFSALHFVALLAFLSWLRILATAFMLGMHYLAHRVMRSIARAAFAGDQLLDGGIDLSLSGGTGEHMKDLVLFLALVQTGTLLSDLAWLLLLLAPLRVAFLVWPLLSPWLRASPPGMEEKPQKRPAKRAHK